jgi:all-trans-8'-apo-beta-carotenal 15,15'-oxygenase
MGDALTTVTPALETKLPNLVDYAPGLEAAFSIAHQEDSYLIEDIEGNIPEFVRGTYYLNGPALFSRAGMSYRHWLDGDGMVCALRFVGQRVYFTIRYVRTTKFLEEEKAGRFVFRTFGTAFPGDRLHRGVALESPANVSVYSCRGVLLAFGEQSLPWQLDPETLETIGSFNFGGVLTDFTPFSAHPKFDVDTHEMHNFGVFFHPRSPKLYFYCFGSDGKLKIHTTLDLELPISLHDFGLSARYSIFYLAPYLMDVDRVTRGGQNVMSSLSWEPWRGSRLLILARNTGKQAGSVPLDARYCLHVINCFEVDHHLYVDVIELDRPLYEQYQPLPDMFTDVPTGGPVRLVIDTVKWVLVARHELDYRLAPDFPAVNPERTGRPYRDFWMLGLSSAGRPGRKFFDQLVRAHWDEGRPSDVFQSAPNRYLGGEPLFIGDPRSEYGAVLCQEFDANSGQAAFLIFDAFHVGKGPVAKLKLKRPIRLGFHASWSPLQQQS